MRLVLLLTGLALYFLAILIEIEIIDGNNFQSFVSVDNQIADILISIVIILIIVFGYYLLSPATNFILYRLKKIE